MVFVFIRVVLIGVMRTTQAGRQPDLIKTIIPTTFESKAKEYQPTA